MATAQEIAKAKAQAKVGKGNAQVQKANDVYWNTWGEKMIRKSLPTMTARTKAAGAKYDKGVAYNEYGMLNSQDEQNRIQKTAKGKALLKNYNNAADSERQVADALFTERDRNGSYKKFGSVNTDDLKLSQEVQFDVGRGKPNPLTRPSASVQAMMKKKKK